MSKFEDILQSFKIKETLNPKVWTNPSEPKKAKMIPKVRKALEKISEEFIDYLGDDVFVQDVILTGSLSNFNWSQYSDFDLHVIVDFSEYGKNEKLYKELFDLKKFVFNTNHDIKIYGHDVELYAQDEKESHFASGVYSVMNDEWVKTPKKEKFDVDEKILKNKINSWTNKIEKAISTSTKSDDKEIIDSVKEKLKEYRKTGLEKDGELSYENLVFKFLRRSGHIERLFDMKNKVMDKELSVERVVQESVENLDTNEIVSNSVFLTELMKMVDENLSFEFTPGQKLIFDRDVEKIQEALQFLGFLLPKYGVDGKYGQETKGAVEQFQKKYLLTPSGKLETKDLKYIIAALIVKKFKDSELSSIQYEKEIDGDIFTYLDLNNPQDYEKYKQICQKFIDHRNSNAQVDGEMMASCAKKYFSRGYVPPELALAQLTLEGGLSKEPNVKPIITKNPFNVGNTDSGKLNYQSSFEDGVCLYYDLMTRSYLTGTRKPEDLLKNFVNVGGNRYASAQDYENDLTSLVGSIKKVTQVVS
jgi:peptidoglycan hydrolase-like protein with peptidoglycan-binding domain